MPAGRIGGLSVKAESLRWIFAKHRTVVVRQASKLDEALLHGDLGDRGLAWCTFLQGCVDRTQPLVAQERDRTHPEYLVEGAVQAASRQAKLRTDLGDVHGPRA